MRTALALPLLAVLAVASALAADPPATSHPGYVDGSAFRALIDDSDEIVEVNLEGPMLQALGRSKEGDGPHGARSREVISKLKAIHAVIGNVKGSTESALALVQQTDKKLAAAGWQRITRIKDESTWMSVLTHVTGDQIDGLVALIFDMEDRELIFANLAGPIDLDSLGEIGDELNVPGLEHVPGAR